MTLPSIFSRNLSVILVLGTACQTLMGCQSASKPEPIVKKAQEVTAVRIHSLPPGCFVELNGEFLGATPIVIRVPSYEGKWTGGLYGVNRLRASIPRGTGFEEKRWNSGAQVPRRVVFRIPGAENWYHANSPRPPKQPSISLQ
jgi:hypothetical protein